MLAKSASATADTFARAEAFAGGAPATPVRRSLGSAAGPTPPASGPDSGGQRCGLTEAVAVDDLLAAMDKRGVDLRATQKLLDESHERESALQAELVRLRQDATAATFARKGGQEEATDGGPPPAEDTEEGSPPPLAAAFEAPQVTFAVSPPAGGAALDVGVRASLVVPPGPGREDAAPTLMEVLKALDAEAVRTMRSAEGRAAVAGVVSHLRSRLKAKAHAETGADWARFFRQQDADQGGNLSWWEFQGMCRSLLGGGVNDAHLRILFRSMDYDRSNSLSIEELIAFVSDPIERMRTRLRVGAEKEAGRDWVEMFRSMDEDHNGVLDWEEFSKLCRQRFKLLEDDMQMATIYRALDADGSGNVTVDELMAFAMDRSGAQQMTVSVAIHGARGLFTAVDGVARNPAPNARIDPYCTCEVLNKPESRIRTKVMSNTENPTWHHEETIGNYNKGEGLVFNVWHKNWMHRDTLLGRAKLPCKRFQEQGGFDGELILYQMGKGVRAFVKVTVQVAAQLVNPRGGVAKARKASVIDAWLSDSDSDHGQERERDAKATSKQLMKKALPPKDVPWDLPGRDDNSSDSDEAEEGSEIDPDAERARRSLQHIVAAKGAAALPRATVGGHVGQVGHHASFSTTVLRPAALGGGGGLGAAGQLLADARASLASSAAPAVGPALSWAAEGSGGSGGGGSRHEDAARTARIEMENVNLRRALAERDGNAAAIEENAALRERIEGLEKQVREITAAKEELEERLKQDKTSHFDFKRARLESSADHDVKRKQAAEETEQVIALAHEEVDKTKEYARDEVAHAREEAERKAAGAWEEAEHVREGAERSLATTREEADHRVASAREEVDGAHHDAAEARETAAALRQDIAAARDETNQAWEAERKARQLLEEAERHSRAVTEKAKREVEAARKIELNALEVARQEVKEEMGRLRRDAERQKQVNHDLAHVARSAQDPFHDHCPEEVLEQAHKGRDEAMQVARFYEEEAGHNMNKVTEMSAEIEKLRRELMEAQEDLNDPRNQVAADPGHGQGNRMNVVAKLSAELERVRRKRAAAEKGEDWRNYTPFEIAPGRCMARTSKDRHGLKGGQCGKLRVMGKDYCREHVMEDHHQWGRVDGAIPEAMIQSFLLRATSDVSSTAV